MSQIQQIDQILEAYKRIEDIDTTFNQRKAYLKGWADGFKEAFQKFCKHSETIDIGDEDHIAVACTLCEKVLEEDK